MHDMCKDNSFRPITNGCQRGWDFTLLFEDAILSIIPSLLFLISGLGRLVYLQSQFQFVLARRFQLFKIAGPFTRSIPQFYPIYAIIESQYQILDLIN